MMAACDDDVESLTERQEHEIQFLEAIYMDDVKDLRKNDPWKIHRPPEVQITLGPQESVSPKEAHVHVDLVVKCPTTYPEDVPSLRLENPKGLSNQQVDVLKEELEVLAKKLVGEVMILDLCHHVQKYLHLHNKPPTASFYDEMITNKRRLEEKHAREQEKRQQREMQQIEEEIQKRQEALKEDARKRRELARQSSDSKHNSGSEPSTEVIDNLTPIIKEVQSHHHITDSPSRCHTNTQSTAADCNVCQKPGRKSYLLKNVDDTDWRTSTPLAGDGDTEDILPTTEKNNLTILTFDMKRTRKVYMGNCLGHSPHGSTVYAGMDISTGELVAISEWIVKWRHTNRKLNLDEREMDEKEANKYMKQVAAIEKEISGLLRLNHRHIVHYQAFKYIQESGQIILYVLMDYVGGGSLDVYLRCKEPIPLDLMRHYTHNLLEALIYIHNKAVVHKDIRASSLLLDRDGKLRLADISLTKRLSDLMSEVNSKYSGSKFKDQLAPVIGGRGKKKSDIYKMGLVLLSLAKGEPITDTLPEIPTSLPQELQDFLTKCLIRDEFHRWSAQELYEHSFVKMPLYTQPPTIEKKKKPVQNTSDDESDQSSEEHVIPFIPASDSGSRLQNEFEIIRWIGKGGFGDVIKVKNKLDGRFYAIKRIPLNPNKKSFTKKITREVKLLSMLNHENVVRYYNSWIETSTESVSNYCSSTYISSSAINVTDIDAAAAEKKSTKESQSEVLKNSLGLVDNIEKDIPPAVEDSIEWSVSCDIINTNDDESSDDDDDDDVDVFGASFLPHSDSDYDDGIIFEHNSNSEDVSDSEMQKPEAISREKPKTDEDEHLSNAKIQFLYIQMEFCEKSTLRNCIDAGLYEDVDRVWQLFREIVEGLVHIHEQGMIHRDLKPVNIFLDSNDHVKIGDFGLATTNILAKQQTNLIDLALNPSIIRELNCSSSHSESTDDMHDLTGKVGTALYVAPEVITTSKRVHYSQKVDIYSLGVIFFEMCYHPLPTGMERVKILTSLREPSIQLPEDFDEDKLCNQVHLIRLLLSHDPRKRPTASEILQSECLPPPQMEEAELNEVLRSTIANPDSKLYKRMIDAIFSQPITPAMDFAYDNELYKLSNQFSQSQVLTSVYVSDIMEKIFRKHGAIRVSTPILMPKCKLYENNESYVCFMDHIGGLVALPYDLKAPFARFVARHGITDLKRYTIGKVYRENRVYGLHPKELLASSFDIVTPTSSSFIPDAEVITIVFEIIAEFPQLKSRNYFLRINHRLLMEGILLYCGVPKELHQDVCAILGDTKNERQKKTQIQTRLYSLSLSEHTVDTLYNFVETEGPFGKVASMLRRITKTKGTASSLASKGLKEMEAIINHTESFGFKIQHVLALGLIANVRHYSGAMFQVVGHVQKKRKNITEVLAAGGRYDGMIAQFQKPGSSICHCVVGISIAMERVIAAVSEDKDFQVPPAQDVVVCSLGSHSFIKEKLSLINDLWAVGINAVLLYDTCQSLDDVQEHCHKCGISHIVIFKESEGPATVKVRWFERDRILEKKVPISELVTFLQQSLQICTQDLSDTMQFTSSKLSSSVSQTQEPGINNKEISASSVKHQFNITVINADNASKVGKNTRRNYESQIYSNLSSCLANISTKSHIEIVAVELTLDVLKTITAHLELDDTEAAFNSSISSVIERHTRHRKYLNKIFDHIAEVKFEKNIPVIVLYSLKDDSYKVLL